MTDPAATYRTSDAPAQPVDPLEQAHQQALRATESGALLTAMKAWTDASIAVERINQECPALTDEVAFSDWVTRKVAALHVQEVAMNIFSAASRSYVRGHASMPEVAE